MSLFFDENPKNQQKKYELLQFTQQFMHHNNYIKNINMYSFSLSPDSYQPGGKINFEHLGSITLDVNTKEPYNYGEDYSHVNILIYFRYYNILRLNQAWQTYYSEIKYN